MDGQLSFQCILESHLGLGCWPRYCLMLRSQGMNWKSYLLKRKRRPTSPSSGQAAISSQLRHPNLLACHSRAALAAQEGRGRYRSCDGGAFGCRQSSEAVHIGSTSTVTSQTSLPMFMSTEIRRLAKSGLFLWHCPQALVSAPESCVKLNDWSA